MRLPESGRPALKVEKTKVYRIVGVPRECLTRSDCETVTLNDR